MKLRLEEECPEWWNISPKGYKAFCEFGESVGRMPTMDEIYECVKDKIESMPKDDAGFWDPVVLKINGKELEIDDTFFDDYLLINIFDKADEVEEDE